jgi:uncharacterized integral membrane protein
MVRFLKVAILVLCAIVLLCFAFANRDAVTVSFDPFASLDRAAFSIEAPLFAVVIGATMLGVVAGAFATWLSQGRHRRASRQNRVEVDRWRAQAQALKIARTQETTQPALPSDR